MGIVKHRSSAESGALVAVGSKWVEVEIDADKFSVIAAVQRGCRVTFSHGQTRPGRSSVLRVKRVQERLTLFHEESHWGVLFVRCRSATTVMVPIWRRGAAKKIDTGEFEQKVTVQGFGVYPTILQQIQYSVCPFFSPI